MSFGGIKFQMKLKQFSARGSRSMQVPQKKKEKLLLGIVIYTCHPSTQKVEAGGSGVQGQLGLHEMLL